MYKIGKYITYDDVVRSDMAKRLGVQNAPNDSQLANIEALILNIYDKVIDHFNKKIGFNSCFRNEVINNAIKGARNSQHCTGEAIDIDADIYANVTNQSIFTFIKSNLNYDQLIPEDIDSKGNIGWIHVSYSKSNNRKQPMVMIRVNGKPKYFPFSESKEFISSNYLKSNT